MSFSRLDIGLVKHVLSFLNPAGETPGPHRELARQYVDPPAECKYIVHYPIEGIFRMGGLATEINWCRYKVLALN